MTIEWRYTIEQDLGILSVAGPWARTRYTASPVRSAGSSPATPDRCAPTAGPPDTCSLYRLTTERPLCHE
jgi:hypothetical protein